MTNFILFFSSFILTSQVFSLKRLPACGVELYKVSTSKLCGIKNYKLGSSKVCGVKSYKEGSITKNITKNCSKNINPLALALTVDGSDQRPRCGRTTYFTSHPKFGVKAYKKCKHPSFGAVYKSCRNRKFGVQRYKACAKYSYGEIKIILKRIKSSFDIVYRSLLFASGNISLALNNKESIQCSIKKLKTLDIGLGSSLELEKLFLITYGESPSYGSNICIIKNKSENRIDLNKVCKKNKSSLCKSYKIKINSLKWIKNQHKKLIEIESDIISRKNRKLRAEIQKLMKRLLNV